MKKERYEVMPCSASGNDDFHATVVDTHKTSYEKGICECFDVKDAKLIANALNRQERYEQAIKNGFGKNVMRRDTDGK